MPRSRRFTGTLNNYTTSELDAFRRFAQADCVRYCCFGKEVGPSGTPHLQAFWILKNASAFGPLKLLVGNRWHLEIARSDSETNRRYCSKDGDFEEFGDFPSHQGKRTDVSQFVAWGDQFIAERGRAPSTPEVARERPIEFLRFPRGTRLFREREEAVMLREGQPKAGWQSEICDRVGSPADDRRIVFVVDSDGGKGKTWLQQYLYSRFPESVQLLQEGKRDDIAHALLTTRRIFLFNVARGGMQYFPYRLAEQLKDRMVFSPKYNSRMKLWRENVHVVVFANEEPDYEKMSEDRYDIYQI